MRKYNKNQSQEKGSALLIVLMMVMMLTILVLEISFTSQTAYSLAKNIDVSELTKKLTSSN